MQNGVHTVSRAKIRVARAPGGGIIGAKGPLRRDVFHQAKKT